MSLTAYESVTFSKSLKTAKIARYSVEDGMSDLVDLSTSEQTTGLENGFEKPRFFLGFLKNLKISKSPDFRFFRFYYFCPIFSARQHICYSALYAIARPSVRPSVCLSVRHTGGSVKDG